MVPHSSSAPALAKLRAADADLGAFTDAICLAAGALLEGALRETRAS